ncbi:MAG: peroxidase [Caldithrix sp.]|nr:MAG: peroxidase [Caldithrix sp.]
MTHHGAGLRRLTKNEALLEHLKRDYRNAPISSADMAMLDYAAKLTKTPWETEADDVGKLREEGFSDAAILDINQITGYYNFVNRLADGLGVELESYWREKG